MSPLSQAYSDTNNEEAVFYCIILTVFTASISMLIFFYAVAISNVCVTIIDAIRYNLLGHRRADIDEEEEEEQVDNRDPRAIRGRRR